MKKKKKSPVPYYFKIVKLSAAQQKLYCCARSVQWQAHLQQAKMVLCD